MDEEGCDIEELNKSLHTRPTFRGRGQGASITADIFPDDDLIERPIDLGALPSGRTSQLADEVGKSGHRQNDLAEY